jgi:plastocyanin
MDQRTSTRRAFLRTAAGGTALAAATGETTAQEGTTHTVDMTDDLVFDPEDLTIAPGDTVVWDNVGSIGHSVTAYEDDIPGDAEYFASGGFDAEQAARSAYTVGDPDSGDIAGGETYEHTFEVEGTYEYFCIPHETVGMLGTIEVSPGGAPTPGGGEGPVALPDEVLGLGVLLSGAVLVVLGLAYFFMKYGGDYGFADEES